MCQCQALVLVHITICGLIKPTHTVRSGVHLCIQARDKSTSHAAYTWSILRHYSQCNSEMSYGSRMNLLELLFGGNVPSPVQVCMCGNVRNVGFVCACMCACVLTLLVYILVD